MLIGIMSHYAECHHTIIFLNVTMLTVVMLNVIFNVLSVIVPWHHVSVSMVIVIVLNWAIFLVIILSVIALNAILLIIVLMISMILIVIMLTEIILSGIMMC
jgi:hypothetical protein